MARHPSTGLLIGTLLVLTGCGRSTKPATPATTEPAVIEKPGDEGTPEVDVPPVVVTSMNINPDPTVGPNGSALYIVDVETGAMHLFPFSTIEGGPVVGQGMHTALMPDMKKVYVTIGGNESLTLRVVVIEIDWKARVPSPRVVKTLELVDAGTPGNPANGAACHPGGPGIRQEGHGTRITLDGRYLTLSELQNDRLRILDTQTDTFIGEPTTHEDLFAPHGLYPNPAGTLAATTQYWFDHNLVSVWNIDGETGALSHSASIPLQTDEVSGSYQHTVRWLDDTRFYTNATQERHQGDGKSEQSVWLVDVTTNTATPVLKADQILEGVSDIALAGEKLYVAEGNVAQFLAGEETPGHVSVFNISDPIAPTLIKRFSAGDGFPDGFSNAHSLGISADGASVFVESFSSNYLIQLNGEDDSVVRIYHEAEGLDTTHGIYMQP